MSSHDTSMRWVVWVVSGVGLGWLLRSVLLVAPLPARPPFWQFLGVTCPARHGWAAAVVATWGGGVPLQWFSDFSPTFPAALGSVVTVEDATYEAALRNGSGYKFMAFKLQWVWHWTARHWLDDPRRSESPPPRWFVRHWDDSYVFVASLERELRLYNPDEPLLIGHRHYSQGQVAYPDGGNPWCLSVGALRLWHRAGISSCLGKTVSADAARAMLGPPSHPWANCKDPERPGLWCAEDIYLWSCLRRLGVRFVHYRGRSWPARELGTPAFAPTLRRSALGQMDWPDLLATSNDYYAALHPVTPTLMTSLFAAERAAKAEEKLK